ncbi:hypothetical protein [Halorussus aquaticus]
MNPLRERLLTSLQERLTTPPQDGPRGPRARARGEERGAVAVLCGAVAV